MTFDPDAYLKKASSSGFDPDAYLSKLSGPTEAPKPEGIVDSTLHAIGSAGKFFDSYTGAPTRAAVAAIQNGGNPVTAFTAFAHQFGDDPEKAPTGADIAAQAGVSTDHAKVMSAQERQAFDEKYNPGLALALKKGGKKYEDVESPSPAEVAGIGVDLAADPTNLLMVAGPVKKALRSAGLIAEAAEDVSKVAPKSGVASRLADTLQKKAEHLAVNATGATGKQASQFAENAGRELLDKGVVQFGDNQAKISQRAAQALDQANAQIDSALSGLQKNGVKVDANKVYETVRSTINDMKANPSKADVAKMLEDELDNLVKATDAKGSTQFGVQEAEQIKRGYNRKAGNWADPEKSMVGKEMYQTWRSAVEDAAKASDPEAAKVFEEGKKSYGLFAPIQEAAERRAATVNQHPAGGFLDITSGVAGASAGGPMGAVVAPFARRLIAPRLTSSLAVTLDSTASALRKIPELQKIEQSNPALFRAIAERVASEGGSSKSAGEKDRPVKGPSKWANDGLQNLIEHDGNQDQSPLKDIDTSAIDDPKLKDLLISASDLRPGTKAMEKVLSQVKSRVGN